MMEKCVSRCNCIQTKKPNTSVDKIFTVLDDRLKTASISDYSIHLDPQSNTLLGVFRRAGGHKSDDLPSHPVLKKLQTYMAAIMVTGPDNETVAIPLTQVFHLP